MISSERVSLIQRVGVLIMIAVFLIWAVPTLWLNPMEQSKYEAISVVVLLKGDYRELTILITILALLSSLSVAILAEIGTLPSGSFTMNIIIFAILMAVYALVQKHN